MANELLTIADIIRGKKNFDAQNRYMTGTAEEQVTLPDGKKIKTRAGFEKELKSIFPEGSAGYKETGLLDDQIPLNKDLYTCLHRNSVRFITPPSKDFNDFEAGTRYFTSDMSTYTNCPKINIYNGAGYFFVETKALRSDILLQVATSLNSSEQYQRQLRDSGVWGKWYSLYPSPSRYTTTTATSANTVVTTTGELQRSTSSKIFKHDIADIDISNYREALKAVRPVSYRSTEATSDRTDWSWYSFIAEELAAIDPRLVQMDNIEFFEDTKEDGTTFINSRELPEGEYAANGINTNGIVALMVHINQQMLGDIEKLEDEKTQLKRRTTNLEKRMDALDGSTSAE